jgi:hypothetical protein
MMSARQQQRTRSTSGAMRPFFGLLALDDAPPLAVGAILGMPHALGSSHWQLLTNR